MLNYLSRNPYILAAGLTFAIWQVCVGYFDKPIENTLLALFVYLAILPISAHCFMWNILKFKSVVPPGFWESTRIPLTAMVLGVHSGFSYIIVAPGVDGNLLTSTVEESWLSLEVLLTVSLVVGIFRWDSVTSQSQARLGPENPPHS